VSAEAGAPTNEAPTEGVPTVPPVAEDASRTTTPPADTGPAPAPLQKEAPAAETGASAAVTTALLASAPSVLPTTAATPPGRALPSPPPVWRYPG